MPVLGLDLMGGDNAPQAVLQAVDAVLPMLQRNTSLKVYGPSSYVHEITTSHPVDFIVCSQVVTMEEHPVEALRHKKDSSLFRALKDLAADQNHIVLSAGHSGALAVGGMQFLGLQSGISRPVVASFLPRPQSEELLALDLGLNPDFKPEHILEYALLAKRYFKQWRGREAQSIALLNTGAEATKGSKAHQEAHRILSDQEPLFIGNIEAREVLQSEADILLSDGFSGNILLKSLESFYKLSTQLGLEHPFLDRLNYREYGGATLLGLRKPVLLGHGASDAEAIKNMILRAESDALATFVD